MAARTEYKQFSFFQTRWHDNDMYGHVNNVEYYSYFDTVINTYLIRTGLLDVINGPFIGVCAESNCRFGSSFALPETIDAGLRVDRLGKSSVRYDFGLFCEGDAHSAAEGWFVQVFVDRFTRKPTILSDALRAALAVLQMEQLP